MQAWEREFDWIAAAADRFPFPKASRLYVDWRENDLEFRHPLGGGTLYPEHFPTTAAVGEDWVNSALRSIAHGADGWKTKYFRTWRLWPERCAREKNPLLAYLVADTRIPDHTLWHHNGLASALTSPGSDPAFLLFQIGPVQEFIAQARKVFDLWSGSYLLSYLIAQGMLAIADEIGPDTIIYPQLRGVPLADWYWFAEAKVLPDQLKASHPNELLTPSLPNRFLALIPAGYRRETDGMSLPEIARQRIEETWRRIQSSVHAFLDTKLNGRFPDWDALWEKEVARFPTMDWMMHRWLPESKALDETARGEAFPPGMAC